MNHAVEQSGQATPATILPEPASSIIAYDRWRAQAPQLREQFAAGRPFPFLVLDDFLDRDAADRALATFPPAGDGWIHYMHYNQRTYGMNDRSYLPDIAAAVLDELNSERFVDLVSELTGVAGLYPDLSLEGGGLHLTERGGHLNLHADFTAHPHRPTWRRHLNLLIYLNPGWQESWGGSLELWDAAVTRCEQRIEPLHNRAVIFRTDARSFHGYPDPLRCPEGVTRRGFAVYYFTDESPRPPAIATNYRGRPDDGARRLLIYLDTMLLRAYDRVKRTFGFDDAFANRVLRTLSRRDRHR